jgi:hypothetical protein
MKNLKGTAHQSSWVNAGEVTAQLSKRGRDTYLTVVMPCGPLDAVVTINDNTMRITGQRAFGASGCEEGKGERRDWVLNLLEGSVELDYSNNTLSWSNGKDSLSSLPPDVSRRTSSQLRNPQRDERSDWSTRGRGRLCSVGPRGECPLDLYFPIR